MTPTPWPGGWRRWYSPEAPVRIGVSSCLLGDAVRYDGGHKRDSALERALGPWAQWVRACPEVDAGMGVPRPPVRLEERGGRVRMVDPASGRDHTEAMTRSARERVQGLSGQELDGYVLKSASPSCGLGSAKVFRRDPSRGGWPVETGGTGLFAVELRRACPDLPVVEERDFRSTERTSWFLEAVFARNRWRAAVASGGGVRSRLVAFHEAHKFQVWARDEDAMRRLGRLVGDAARLPGNELAARYGAGFLAAMSGPATHARHVNVLQHAQGWLKRLLASDERRALSQSVEDYRLGRTPWSVPAETIRRLALRHQARYLLGQLYFDPSPRASVAEP